MSSVRILKGESDNCPCLLSCMFLKSASYWCTVFPVAAKSVYRNHKKKYRHKVKIAKETMPYTTARKIGCVKNRSPDELQTHAGIINH